MQIIQDILGFIKALTEIDLLLYFAVLVLIILIVSLIYIIKTSEEEEEILPVPKENQDDLKSIVTTLENTKPPALELTDYEAEQEERAIISYEELLAKNGRGSITYEEENRSNDEITIKKIDLDSLIKKPEEKKSNTFVNYQREEEFLKSLQDLNKFLK